MKLLQKMAGAVGRVLNIRSLSGWYPSGSMGDAGEYVTDTSVLSLSAAWACVNLIAGTTSTLPLTVYRRNKEGEREVARDHPLYRILHDSPNFDQTAVDFIEFLCVSLELRGNAYARKERIGGKIVALHPIDASGVAVRRLPNGSIEYRWSENGKTWVETDANILHIRGFGGTPLGGVSTLQAGRNVFSLAQAIDRSAGTTFKNGLRPSGVLTFDKWLSKEQRDITEEKLTQKFVGALNAGRPLILEGGTKWEQLTFSPEDAQMLQSRGFSVEEVCRFFGVPPFMVGHNEKASGYPSSLEQQVLMFQKFTLRRRLKRMEQAFEQQLLTPTDRAKGISIEFNIEGLLRADSAGRARFYQQMTQIGAMTINEVRALENLPAVDGGDVPRMQMQNVPISEIDREAVRQLIAEEGGQSV
ncbi:phage portal protein [Agrobacterium vitis]|uniref:phage portal protein n=1 Tax=Agrobacterium vitis TaxID=373 RepID=UPI00132737E5|nr:phage portal protein [Agrobacterium vitis]